MQERYLGDSHDYIKFALLRSLHMALKLRIGVNWYLTDPDRNGDGEQRNVLDRPEWERLDKALLDKLRPFRKREYRTLKNFERAEILPGDTLFYKEKVTIQKDCSSWHQQALSALSNAGLIFLDQDNGFQVKSMTRKTQVKYALYQEAIDYSKNGKVVVAIQFASKVDPKMRANEVRGKLASAEGNSVFLPVVRGRVTPNILFVISAPPGRVDTVRRALKAFASHSPVINGIVRIELID